MADFVKFEVAFYDDDNDDYNSEVEDTNVSDIDDFIDDNDYDESVETYYAFTNVNSSLEEAVQDTYDPFGDIIDEFKNSAKRLDNLKSTLLIPHGLENIDSFPFALLLAICNQLKNKKDECRIDELKSDIENDQLYDAILSRKDNFRLDLDFQNFENQCFPVTDLIIKYGLFLRIYELKDKFRYLIKQDSENKTVLRDLSSCVIEKLNDFNIIRVEFSKTIRQTYQPIDTIYNPMRKLDEIINCYFGKRLNLVFGASFSGGTIIKHCTGWQCCFCSNYYA